MSSCITASSGSTPMRRTVALLSAAVLGAAGLAFAAPTSAAPTEHAAATAHEAVPGELLVGYVEGASGADRERARGRASAQLEEHVVSAAAGRAAVELVRLPGGKNRDQAIAELESDSAVAYAE